MKLCPFCGKEHTSYAYWNIVGYDEIGNPIKGEKKYYVDFLDDSDDKAIAYISPETWQTRPIEDALRAEIAKLRAELEQEREKNKWIPVSIPPEDDGTLQQEHCYSKFTGNYYEVVSCYFLCRIEYDEAIYYDIFCYHFDTGNWIPKYQEGMPSDIYKYITHYMPLPSQPEAD